MHALLYDLLPPSGVEFAANLALTPSILKNAAVSASSNASGSFPRSLCNLVVARSNLLQIFEVRKELAPFQYQADEELDKRSRFRRDTEPVEGEVEMDPEGEGFVNMGSVKVLFSSYTTRDDCTL
jgi:cleavage and polyadenylation specificity factor subunit 1